MLVASLHRKWTRCDCHFTFFTVQMHSVEPKQYIYMVHSHFPSHYVGGIWLFLCSPQSFRHVSSAAITGFCKSITWHHVLAECFLYYPSDSWLELNEISATYKQICTLHFVPFAEFCWFIRFYFLRCVLWLSELVYRLYSRFKFQEVFRHIFESLQQSHVHKVSVCLIQFVVSNVWQVHCLESQ